MKHIHAKLEYNQVQGRYGTTLGGLPLIFDVETHSLTRGGLAWKYTYSDEIKEIAVKLNHVGEMQSIRVEVNDPTVFSNKLISATL